MFEQLARFAIMASETPVDEARAWQTKTASQSSEGMDQAFLAGFYDEMLKEASDAETYILGSELGKELGINMLYNIKHSI